MKRYRLSYQADDTPMKRALRPSSFHRRISCSPTSCARAASTLPCSRARHRVDRYHLGPAGRDFLAGHMAKLNRIAPPCRMRCSRRRASRTPGRRGMRRPPRPHRRKLHHLLHRRLRMPTSPLHCFKCSLTGLDTALVVSSPAPGMSRRGNRIPFSVMVQLGAAPPQTILVPADSSPPSPTGPLWPGCGVCSGEPP